VALDNPGAPYANEALDMGLAIAEEMDNPTGGPDILSLYAPSVYYDLTANRTARRTALEIFLTEAEPRLDPEEPQHLLERARYELANLYLEENRWDEGFALLNAVVLKHPDGRYPARALALRGEILLNQGRGDEARRAWEQLLAQFPDYLFIDDVRDDLRAMP
jgi:tetratricopeptide (TPR) repeat protein